MFVEGSPFPEKWAGIEVAAGPETSEGAVVENPDAACRRGDGGVRSGVVGGCAGIGGLTSTFGCIIGMGIASAVVVLVEVVAVVVVVVVVVVATRSGSGGILGGGRSASCRNCSWCDG